MNIDISSNFYVIVRIEDQEVVSSADNPDQAEATTVVIDGKEVELAVVDR